MSCAIRHVLGDRDADATADIVAAAGSASRVPGLGLCDDAVGDKRKCSSSSAVCSNFIDGALHSLHPTLFEQLRPIPPRAPG